jgi:uncharacterized membrane protein
MDWIYGRACGTLPSTRPGLAGPAEGDDMQSIRRDLMKTLSFAALHFGVAFTVAYGLTGSVAVAAGIGLIEPIANTAAFYFHERAWRRVDERKASAWSARPMCCGPARFPWPGRGADASARAVTE